VKPLATELDHLVKHFLTSPIIIILTRVESIAEALALRIVRCISIVIHTLFGIPSFTMRTYKYYILKRKIKLITVN
jgi:hypothetical protein